jgi:hypothetical protein
MPEERNGSPKKVKMGQCFVALFVGKTDGVTSALLLLLLLLLFLLLLNT